MKSMHLFALIILVFCIVFSMFIFLKIKPTITGEAVVSFSIVEESPEEISEDSSVSGGVGCSYDLNFDWNCSKWGECVEGIQTRKCREKNNCGATYGKPNETRICVEGIQEALFDINLKLLKKIFSPQEKLSAVITLINLEVPGKVSAILLYQIKDKAGNILYEEKEIVPVETQIEFIKEINISELNEGEYTLFVDLNYEGQKEPAQAEEEFTISEEDKFWPVLLGKLYDFTASGKGILTMLLINPYILILFLIIIVLVILLCIRILTKVRNKYKMKKLKEIKIALILFIIFLVGLASIQVLECTRRACLSNITIELTGKTIIGRIIGGGRGECSPNWICGEWGECNVVAQSRACYDYEDCGTSYGKPEESRLCKVGEKPEIEIREILFDVNLELLEKTISPQKKLSIIITLINLGVPGKVYADLLYQIEDKKGKIVYEEKEVVPVETQIEFIKEINISELNEGKYTFFVDLSYSSQKEPAQAKEDFDIMRESFLSSLFNRPYILIVFSILVILWVIKLKRIKKTKNSILQD